MTAYEMDPIPNNPEIPDSSQDEPIADPLQTQLNELELQKGRLLLQKQIRTLEDEINTMQEQNPIKRFIKGLNDTGYWDSVDGLTTLAFILSLIMTFLATLNGNVTGTQAVTINAVMGMISTLGTIITNKGAPYGIMPSYNNYISPISAKTEDETSNNDSGGA